MPKVLLIYPSQLYAPRWGIHMQVKSHMLSLFSFLRYNKINAEVLDLENEIGRPKNEDEVQKFSEKTFELISRFDFDIAAISCWSSLNYLSSILVADICRAVNHQSVIAVGGCHPTALPCDFMYERSPFNFIITGKGEIALLGICKKEKRAQAAPGIIQGTPMSLKGQLVADWQGYKYTNIISEACVYLSRGCLYSCDFCMEESKGYKTWRSRSITSAVEEIKKAINILKPSKIIIGDACFGFNKI